MTEPPPIWTVSGRRALDIVKRGGKKFLWIPAEGKLKRRTAVAALLSMLLASPVRAAFDIPSLSAQAAAMGGASLSGRGDSSALFLNAASGAGLARPEAYLAYTQLFAGLEGVGGIGQGFASLGVPTRAGTFAVGLSNFRASDLLAESVIGVNYSRLFGPHLAAGVTGKYMHHRYLIGSDPLAAADPVFRGGTGRGAPSFDAGLILSPTPVLRFGLAVRNVNSPDMGLATEDRIPREFQAGLSYDVARWGLRMTADYAYRAIRSGAFRDRMEPSLGMEKSLEGERVKFRLGVSPDQLSGGAGLQLGVLAFDYTFTLSRHLIAHNAGNHRIGLRYQF